MNETETAAQDAKKADERDSLEAKNIRLQKENAALRAELEVARGQWISVEERLPQAFMCVLLCDGEDCTVGYWDSEQRKWEYPPYVINRPTRWAPLPAPPQSEESKL